MPATATTAPGPRLGLNIFCTADSIRPARVATEAESLGFDTIYFPDHTHIPVARETPWPGGGALPREYARIFDPFLSAMSAASATSRIRVALGVCVVPLRDPILLARQAASLDVLSNGRLILGVGAGWNLEEIRNHGVDPSTRWDVMRERVLAIRRIWTEDEPSFHGKFVDFDPIWSWPKPAQSPGPPVLIGGDGPSLASRIAEYGDGWLATPSGNGTPVAERMEEIAAAAAEVGRSRPTTHVYLFGPTPPEAVVEKYFSAGVTEVILQLPSAGPERVLPVLERFGRLLDSVRKSAR